MERRVMLNSRTVPERADRVALKRLTPEARALVREACRAVDGYVVRVQRQGAWRRSR
jgi:hypothetical protein